MSATSFFAAYRVASSMLLHVGPSAPLEPPEAHWALSVSSQVLSGRAWEVWFLAEVTQPHFGDFRSSVGQRPVAPWLSTGMAAPGHCGAPAELEATLGPQPARTTATSRRRMRQRFDPRAVPAGAAG